MDGDAVLSPVIWSQTRGELISFGNVTYRLAPYNLTPTMEDLLEWLYVSIGGNTLS